MARQGATWREERPPGWTGLCWTRRVGPAACWTRLGALSSPTTPAAGCAARSSEAATMLADHTG
eukprot:1472089-Alexandrium_andersonii.AAC.1